MGFYTIALFIGGKCSQGAANLASPPHEPSQKNSVILMTLL